MNKQDSLKWYYLVYVRVSSQRQVNEGDGLGSQEQRCVFYIKSQGQTVEKVFRDEGISGGLFDRPAINALLTYIDDNPHKNYVVVFDDLSRLARDTSVYLRLKMELKARGVKLECPNFNFDDTPEGEFIETIIASKAELDRKQNRRQVIQKQKARLDRGYWPFCPPLGLKHIKSKEHGKILVSREPYATIFKEAIEGYEKDLLNSETEVQEFINLKFKENGLNRTISKHGVQATLDKCLYAGFIEYKPWEVDRRNGKHQGFISKKTFENVQNKRLGRSKPRMGNNYSNDFPLRGFVKCKGCGKPLRASWNTGRSKKYPNYWCQTKGCEYRYKIVRREVIHQQFEKLLAETKIDKNQNKLSKAIFMDAWNTLVNQDNQLSQGLQKELKSISEKVDSLVERISQASNQALISTYEEKVTKLSNRKTEIKETLKVPKYTDQQFGTALNKVFNVLENPISLWNSDNLEDKHTVLYMFFENGLSYRYGEGFGTANFSDGINLLRDSANGKIPDVEMAGFAPASANQSLTISTDLVYF